jgi:hypothetical protein
MQAAAQEEKNLAIRENRVDVNGIPKILVTADGAWSKRSYGYNYSAPSGIAAIVGYRSGKFYSWAYAIGFALSARMLSVKTSSERPCLQSKSA